MNKNFHANDSVLSDLNDSRATHLDYIWRAGIDVKRVQRPRLRCGSTVNLKPPRNGRARRRIRRRSGNLLAVTVYGAGSTNSYYAIKDHLNGVYGFVDASGAVVAFYDYESRRKEMKE